MGHADATDPLPPAIRSADKRWAEGRIDGHRRSNEQEESMRVVSSVRRGISRRWFLGAAAVAAGALAAPRVLHAAEPYEQAPLPYAENALEPVISATTIGFHYGKHHAAYVANLNKALAAAPELADLTVEELLKATAIDPDRAAIYNNLAQHWNHAFYWNSMRPGGGGEPSGKLLDKIDADLGGYDKFREAFKTAATTQFGSGWAWLTLGADGKLAIGKTANADNPVVKGDKPLLTIDVWEHAYYLDYQNRRADYVSAWLDKLVNWDFAERNLG
jgi:superoxide dismutase, Fe-Mn family